MQANTSIAAQMIGEAAPEKKSARSSTLVIHPEDRSTTFLTAIYAGTDWTVLSEPVALADMRRAIQDHDRIIMLGHGSPSGLFWFQYGISDAFADLLRTKDCVCIWCNADQYAKRNKLSGLVTGMFISEVGEARMFDIDATQADVDASNKTFSAIVRSALDLGRLPDYVKQCYNHPSCLVTKFNSARIYHFDKGVPTNVVADYKPWEPERKKWEPTPTWSGRHSTQDDLICPFCSGPLEPYDLEQHKPLKDLEQVPGAPKHYEAVFCAHCKEIFDTNITDI